MHTLSATQNTLYALLITHQLRDVSTAWHCLQWAGGAAACTELFQRDCAFCELRQHGWSVMDQLGCGKEGAFGCGVWQVCKDGAHLRVGDVVSV